MYDVVYLEELKKPTIALVNQGFVTDGHSAAALKGYPGIRIIPENIPCECSVAEEIESGLKRVLDDIIVALISPLTQEEQSPMAKEPEKPSRITFKGNLEEINRFFYRRGWGDGLPVIPPTEAAVAEMLTGTDLPPDQVIAKIEPRLGKATVEKIAVNAVMAGALPIHMPLLIAGVKTLVDSESGFAGWTVSTGSWSPFWIVNGPVRQDVRVNCSSGALSPGDIANAAIGRALQLIIKNVGGARKGIEDMGVIGNPGKYSLVIGENEEASPWEPLSVEQGFKKEDSTISLLAPNCSFQMMPYGSDDKGIMRAIAYNIAPAFGGSGVMCIILIPSHAKVLAERGWKKSDIKMFLSQHARTQLYRIPQYYGNGLAWVESNKNGLLMNPWDAVSVKENPNSIRIIVAGGPGNIIGCLTGSPGIRNPITRKVELPPNWTKLVEKYRGVAPSYIKY